MKIPETGNGTYYGGEENGQWQLNGVVLDNGVGGGIVGSGDAGVLRPAGPVYPVHMPRGGPMSGFVVSGGFYGAAAAGYPGDDFADYMWMENEEEFDKQVMQQLEEEALMEQCIEAMLEDEQRERSRAARDGGTSSTTSGGPTPASLREAVSKSTLNPLAAEFVPGRARPPPDERLETKERPPEDVGSPEPEAREPRAPEEREWRARAEPPEVSAADARLLGADAPKPRADKRKARARSAAAGQPGTPAAERQSPPPERGGGAKPANYAAAARAPKPQKPAAAPADRSPPPPPRPAAAPRRASAK